MKKLFIPIILLLPVLLGGCAGGHSYIENDKDLELDYFKSITFGMDESKVIEILGLPIKYGIDEEERNYLHYVEINSLQFIAILLLPGASGSASTTVIQGFEGRIYLDDDKKVVDVHVKEWQD